MGKVLVDLKKTKHISIIGGVGYGKTTYARYIVNQVLDKHKDLRVIVYGARDTKWEELERMGLITLYSMEETIKKVLRGELDEVNEDEETLVVIDDIGYTLQMLPTKEHKQAIERIKRLIASKNTHSVITSLRTIDGYYPRDILEVANTKIALKLGIESDYSQYFGSKSYLTNQQQPTEVAEAYIDTETTNQPIFIKSSKSMIIK